MIGVEPQGPYCAKFNSLWTVTGGSILPYDRTDAFTLFAWVRNTNTNTGAYIVSNMDNTPDGWGFTLQAEGAIKAVANQASGSGALSVQTARSIGNGWHSIAVVKAATGALASDFTFYIDGVAVAQATPLFDTFSSGSMISGSQVLRLGARSTTATAFGNAFVKNVCLYSAALTAGNITTLHAIGRDGDYSSTLTPAANWRLNDPTKEHTTILDYSGNDRNLTVSTGRSSYQSQCDVGPTGWTMDLDGSDEYVSIGNFLAFERTDPFSIAAWVKFDAVNCYIVAKHESGTNRGYGFAVGGDGKPDFILLSTNGISQLRATSDTTLSTGIWYHLCVTYDGSSDANNVAFYVNGVVTSKTTPLNTLGGTIVTTTPLLLAARSGPTGFLNGKLAQVAFYNDDLTAGQVTTIYNNRVFADLTQVGPTANLVGYWPICGGDTISANGVLDLSVGNHPGSATNMEANDFIPVYGTELV